MNQTSAEVIVIGGGPAGASLSLRLARVGCPVILLERSAFDAFRVGESLPPAAVPRLKRLGVWDAFLQTRPAAVYGVQSAWGTEELESSSFLGDPFLNGWHLDRLRFDAMLTSAAEDAGALVFRRACAHIIELGPGKHWSVAASSPQRELRILSRFLVDASGRSARLCQGLGVRRLQSDRLIGISALCAEKSPREPFPSLVEAHPFGWWYSAGLPDGRVIAIFFTDSDLSAQHGLTRAKEWSGLLEESRHTRERLSACILPHSLNAFSATSHFLDRAAGDSWLAIGDALIGRDPLSSSGIDFALASAELASSLLCALSNGRGESVNAYNGQARSDFAAYLQQRCAYYALERRWPDSPFWLRRHSVPTAVGLSN